MSDGVKVFVQLLNTEISVPEYAYPGDAGFDLRATHSCVLKPFERKAISCGIALEIPEGYAGFVLPRSGLAMKHGISIVNAPGLIDSGYRGEIKVILINLDEHEAFSISKGDRIAQLVILQTPRVVLCRAESLSETSRGVGGFGSSGING